MKRGSLLRLALGAGALLAGMLTHRHGEAAVPTPIPVKPVSVMQQWQPNLSTWTTATMAANNGVSGTAPYPIAWLNNRFLANGTLTGMAPSVISTNTSTDGLTWSGFGMTFSVTSGRNSASGWNPSAYGYQNGVYVMGFTDGVVYTSPDAANWSPGVPGTNQSLNAVACGGGKCVFGSTGGLFVTSTDATLAHYALHGVSTPTGTVEGSNPAYTINSMAYGAGRFVAVTSTRTACAGCGTGTGYIFTSTDGATWTVAGTSTGFNGVTYGPSGFVAVGLGGGYSRSLDGVTWMNGTNPGPDFNAVACAPTVCVAVAGGQLYASPTLNMSWTQRTSIAGQFYGVAMGAGKFVAYGRVYASPGLVAMTSGNVMPP